MKTTHQNNNPRPGLLNRSTLVIRLPFLGLLLAMTLVWVSPQTVRACDACNMSFVRDLLAERSDSLIGRDILAAIENQRHLALDGFSNPSLMNAQLNMVDAARGPAAEPPATMVAEADVEPVAEAEPAAAEEPAPAEPEAVEAEVIEEAPPAPTPARAGEGRVITAEQFAGDPFIEIIERDYGLSIPPTSYVPQDTEPDHRFTVELHEGMTYLGNGVVYNGFLTNGKIPGPTIIVDEGDIVEMTIVNNGTIPHGASIHAAYTQTSKYLGNIPAGQSKSVVFRATYPGVFLYHCAPGGHAIPMHVLFGQYGMMVVNPKQKYALEEELGREPDLKLYLSQHELYADGQAAVEGNATYTMFNGRLFRYVEEPISVRPGDYVRIYFLNVGPNLLSTFHIVGIVWDYVYWQGHPEARWPGGQSVTAGPTDSWVIEFRIPPDEGAYTMLSHAVGSTSRGAIGLLVAEEGADTPPVVLADGPLQTQEELEEIRAEASRVIAPFEPTETDRATVFGWDQKEVDVRIVGNSYYPKIIEIEPGTTVTWTNDDVFTYLAGEVSGVHNVAGVSGPEPFGGPLLAHAETYTETFTEPGEYEYICTPHPYMRGKIIVREPTMPDFAVMEEAAPATGTLTWWALPILGITFFMAAFALFKRNGGND